MVQRAGATVSILPRLLRMLRVRDTLSHRMLVVYGAMLIAFFAVIAVVTAVFIAPKFTQLDAAEAAHRREIVKQALNAEKGRLGDLTRTYAVWDDAYRFAQGERSDFTSVNFSPAALEQIELSEVLIFDRDQRVLFTGRAGAKLSNALSLSVAGAAAAAPSLLDRSQRGVATAVVTAPDGAALVSVADIVRSDGSGKPLGRMVFVRAIDAALLDRLRVQTNTPVELALNGENAPKNNRILIDDAYGRPSLSVVVAGAKSARALAMDSLAILSFCALGALLLVAVLMGRWLSIAVVEPVRRLAQEIRKGGGADWNAKASPQSPDELVEFRAAFDEAFGRIRDEVERQRVATQDAELARGAAERATQAKSHFFAQMSHELRTPLHAIIGYAEIIEEEWLEAENHPHRRDLQAIQDAARHLLALVNEILDLARLSGKQEKALFQTVELEVLVRKVFDAVRSQLLANDLRLTLDIEPGLEEVVTDERMLFRILSNLLSHSVSSASGDRVMITARRGRRDEEPRMVLSLAIDGLAFSEAERKLLFEPFSASSGGGAGLRLAITHELVLALNGDIQVDHAKAKGSVFCIVLPLGASARSPKLSAV